MKSIMSINNKFMTVSPSRLVEISNKYKYVDGFEIYVHFDNKYEVDYLINLANVCKKENKILQIHGDCSLNIDKQKEFIDLLYNFDMNYPISMVIHSIYDEDKEVSINKTIEYTSLLTDYIDPTKIRLSIENLNDMDGMDRLDKNDIAPIICNNEKLYMTYDLGHEIIDYGNITDLLEPVKELISNVHIHTFSYHYSLTFDHKPILESDDHWNAIIKGILFLKNNKYEGNIVFEYAIDECRGDTLEERIASYCESMDFVSERFN